MNPSLEHLAAVAAAGVPGLLPVSVGPSPDDDADFRSAVVSDSTDRRWRVRSPLSDEAAIRLASEHAVLRAFSPALRATLPFHLPTVVGSVEDRGRRAFIYSHLPGRPIPLDELTELADVAPVRPQPPSAAPVPGVAEQLGGLIAAIHHLPRAVVMDADLPAYSAEQCRRRLLNELDQAATTGRIPAALLRRWETALEDRTLWRFSTRVVHGDLHEDNLIVEGNRITAVTGWTDMHVGDPAADLAWLIGASDTSFAEAVVAAYSRAAAEESDPHLLRRAHLEAEFALARWLVRGLSRDLPELTQDAQEMLRILEADVDQYESGQAANHPPQAEGSVAARAEHARPARERVAQPGPAQDPGLRRLDDPQAPSSGRARAGAGATAATRAAVGSTKAVEPEVPEPEVTAARTASAEPPPAGPGAAGSTASGSTQAIRPVTSPQERVRREGRRRAELDAAHTRTRLFGDLLEDTPESSAEDSTEDSTGGSTAAQHGDRSETEVGGSRTGATVTPIRRADSAE